MPGRAHNLDGQVRVLKQGSGNSASEWSTAAHISRTAESWPNKCDLWPKRMKQHISDLPCGMFGNLVLHGIVREGLDALIKIATLPQTKQGTLTYLSSCWHKIPRPEDLQTAFEVPQTCVCPTSHSCVRKECEKEKTNLCRHSLTKSSLTVPFCIVCEHFRGQKMLPKSLQ